MSAFHEVSEELERAFREPATRVAGAVGQKDKVVGALPDHTIGRLRGNQNFINNSTTLTIRPAEGAAVAIIGKQDGAPPLDLHLVIHWDNRLGAASKLNGSETD
jgi:hypothetical protein